MSAETDEDIAARYPQLRDRPLAMAMLAEAMLAKGNPAEAYALGSAAVALAPHDMQVRDVVRHAIAADIPAYHGAMLHDEQRNRAYANAIERVVRPGMVVLEIGSGAGLLSLIAARAGARVFTCELNPIVAAAAARIAALNGLADRITVIPKRSTDLEVGIDLPEPADMLMSELFDDTLFGDNIILYLEDARKRLLKPEAPILPRFSELRCALVEHQALARRRPLTQVEGFDLSPFNLLQPPSQLRALKTNSEPRSEPVAALAMDYHAAPFGALKQRVRFHATGGPVNGVVQWLYFDFGDGNIYENNPFTGPPSHWGAPVFALTEPRETVPGEEIEARIELLRNRLTVTID